MFLTKIYKRNLFFNPRESYDSAEFRSIFIKTSAFA